ncbi:ankyrin-2 isoform X5, putative [Babesia ovata]|uniref:Ankyrin-2 isoform X5, putative n=1 Tax=Babesia ovata TaxID=189622 RepID=A0A2H6KCM9_9APIC|nr:ankyrin-2 isoform X5, putative [Babesia ovata]GBE60748.1 ankyrin-2 isoform X5, putative [Babesia ovata]
MMAMRDDCGSSAKSATAKLLAELRKSRPSAAVIVSAESEVALGMRPPSRPTVSLAGNSTTDRSGIALLSQRNCSTWCDPCILRNISPRPSYCIRLIQLVKPASLGGESAKMYCVILCQYPISDLLESHSWPLSDRLIISCAFSHSAASTRAPVADQKSALEPSTSLMADSEDPVHSVKYMSSTVSTTAISPQGLNEQKNGYDDSLHCATASQSASRRSVMQTLSFQISTTPVE